MANIFPTQQKLSPGFTEPDLILTYAQASGAFAALEGGKPRVKIGSEDMAVYINRLDIRTNAMVGQSPANLLPSAELQADFITTPTYLHRVRAIWDHHDMARAADYRVALPAAQDLACRQGIFQMMRTGLLFGFNAANGEGLMNTVGATKINLPPDPFGNTNWSTYDNGALALFWLSQIVTLKSGMYQSGGNIKNRIVVISPQQEFLQFVYANIVQVVAFQRPGAGTATTGVVVKDVASESGDTFEWYFDDTLIGQGTNSGDPILLTIPEIETPDIPHELNTNVFGSDMNPKLNAVNLMYQDMTAPMKIPTPTPDGAITEIHELRTTSGWCIRPQGIFIISGAH
jgi:hypothetical protein